MKYEFSKKEKTLMLVLVILAIVIGYFKFFLEPLNEKIDTYNTQSEELETELTLLTAQKVQYDQMVSELETLRQDPSLARIPAYDNSKALLKDLYSTLESAIYYSVTPSGTYSIDYIFVRPISISFNTNTYDEARSIIDDLDESDVLEQIGDINMELDSDGVVRTSLVVTYYELMDTGESSVDYSVD